MHTTKDIIIQRPLSKYNFNGSNLFFNAEFMSTPCIDTNKPRHPQINATVPYMEIMIGKEVDTHAAINNSA